MVNNDSSFLVRFSNCFKEIVVFHSELTVERSLHDQFRRRNRRQCAAKCLFHKQLSLACLRRLTWWTVVLFRAHAHRSMICHLWRDLINVFWSTAIVFFQHFYASIDKNLFWAIAGFSENKSFLRSGVHAISNVCWWGKCPSLSHGMSCIINGRFRRNFTISSFSEHRPRLNSLNQFFIVL